MVKNDDGDTVCVPHVYFYGFGVQPDPYKADSYADLKKTAIAGPAEWAKLLNKSIKEGFSTLDITECEIEK